MKHQQVSVDYWTMLKTMVLYGFLALMGWVMLRLFSAVFLLPRRLQNQNQSIQKTLEDLQKRFPDLQVTEEDLRDAEKEVEEYQREQEKLKLEKEKCKAVTNEKTTESPDENKKTL